MKVCVFGAGAIGGYMAAALDKAGADVSIIARGEHLEAIKANGLRLRKDGAETVHRVHATSDASELGVQDYVIIGVKAHAIAPVINSFGPLLGSGTAIVPALNGIPWWYFHGLASGHEGHHPWLESVDPGGVQWRFFGPARAIGCVVYPACDVPEPGVINHKSGDRFTLGEPDGSDSQRLHILSDMLIAGGLKAPRKARLRDEIWIKLWGNCSFNPVSALTGASLDLIGADDALCGVIYKMMEECRRVGESLGARFSVDIPQRMKGGISIIGHKPSTRHDVELGRPMEIDPLVSSVLELARRQKIETPTLDAIAALLRMQGQILGLYSRQTDVEERILPDDLRDFAARLLP
ncbi:2-dehydropantoate 2-reductase [Ensifer adhaerens]|nr:2-dehydropantoate 2-reductase [Ensifer adhaerens]MDF8357551.1 2-dehydropantoate 2-reductase [Ensifer adhaerens]